MINVVNHYKHKPTDDDVVIMRPSILGNPYSHKEHTSAQFKVASREEAVERYSKYLPELCKSNAEVRRLICELARKHAAGAVVNLVCCCSPAKCHGEVIKVMIEHVAKQLKERI